VHPSLGRHAGVKLWKWSKPCCHKKGLPNLFRVREGLLLIMVTFSVCHVLFARVLLSSPAVLCVHRPLFPAELTRPFFFDGPNSLLHSLALTPHLFHRLLFVWSHWIVLSPSPSNHSNELNSSGTYFLIRFLSFLSFFLFSSSSLAQSTKIWRGY